MVNPEQSKRERPIPPKPEKELEEKTVYGSFQDTVEEYRGKIDAGEFKSSFKFFSVSRPALMYQKGELIKRCFEKEGLSKGVPEVGRAFNWLKVWEADSQLARYPAMPDIIDFSSIADKESIKKYSREYPFLAVEDFHSALSDDLLELFDYDSVKNYLRENPAVAMAAWNRSRSEKFLDLMGEDCVREYSRREPKAAIESFVLAPPKVFGWFDKEAIKKFSSEEPGNAIFNFSKSASEELFDLFDKEALKENARKDPSATLEILVLRFDQVEKKTKKIFELLDKNFLKNYFHDWPEYAFGLCLRVNSNAFLDLMDFQDIKKSFAEKEALADERAGASDPKKFLADPGPGVRMFMKNRALFEKLDLRDFYSKLPVNYFEKHLERFGARQKEQTVNLIKEGFHGNESNLFFNLSGEELADLSKDFDSLFEENVNLKPDEKLSTIGAEIEVLNNESAEIRLPIVSQENLKPLLKFFSDFSVLTFQKFDEARKAMPERFPGYPHSNLHLNFGLTEKQLETTREHGDVLEDISWCYSMAYSPFSRLAYLDGGGGRDKWNSNDTDVEMINPKTAGRYQVRYFSLGGSKGEIKSSLLGISKMCALLPELFDNPRKCERVKNFLKENDEIKNRALELRWIREQVGELDEKRKEIDSLIATAEMLLKVNRQMLEIKQLREESLLKERQDIARTLREDAQIEAIQEIDERRAALLSEIAELKNKEGETRDTLNAKLAEMKELDQKNGKFRNYFTKVQEMMQLELARFA